MTCPCSCTYTATLKDGRSETFGAFVRALKWSQDNGVTETGVGAVKFKRNTDVCPCKCYNCRDDEVTA